MYTEDNTAIKFVFVFLGIVDGRAAIYIEKAIGTPLPCLLCSYMENLSRSYSTKLSPPPPPLSNFGPTMADIYLITIRTTEVLP